MTQMDELIARARYWRETASPEEKAAMWKAQRESWNRAFEPCEHGDPDWETCPHCLAALRSRQEKQDG